MSPIKRKNIISLWIVMGLVALFLSPLNAQEKGDDNPSRQSLLKKRVVHITIKNKNSIIANGERFRISGETVIIDERGVKIPFSDMAFPCTVTIFYAPELYDNPMISKIMVKETDIGARTGLTPPYPE